MLESFDGGFDGSKEVAGTELLEESAVLEVVVYEVRRTGDRQGHALPAELGHEVPQCPQPGVVDVGDGNGIEDHCVHGGGRSTDELAGPVTEVVGVAVPQRRVHEVDDDPGYLLGRVADVDRDPNGRCRAHARGPCPGAGQSASSGRPATGP